MAISRFEVGCHLPWKIFSAYMESVWICRVSTPVVKSRIKISSSAIAVSSAVLLEPTLAPIKKGEVGPGVIGRMAGKHSRHEGDLAKKEPRR